MQYISHVKKDKESNFEIQSNDPQKCIEFYNNVFDWKFTKQEGLPIEYYRIEGELHVIM